MSRGRTNFSKSVPAGISLGNWLSAPYSQWSFQHVDDFVPTAVISRGIGRVAALPAASAPVAEIPVTTTDGAGTTVGAVMATTATDGWAVAYRGSMVAEEYLDGLEAETRHLLFSVSKSLVAAVVGALHGAEQQQIVPIHHEEAASKYGECDDQRPDDEAAQLVRWCRGCREW